MKKWKVMLVVLLVLATSLTGFILVKRHQAKTALEAYRKEFRAQHNRSLFVHQPLVVT